MAYDNILYVNTASISNGWFTGSFKGDGSQLTIPLTPQSISASWASSSLSANYILPANIANNYSASVSTIFGTKQDNLVNGNTYLITASWANNVLPSGIANNYSSSISTQIGLKQDALVTGNTYAITSSWANNILPSGIANNYSSSVAAQINSKQNNIVNGSTLQVTSSWAITSSLAITSSFATTASYYLIVPAYKSGILTPAAFGGNPETASVTFGTPFPDANYSATVAGGNARIWTVENVLAGSFIISSNSIQPIDENVYWQAMKVGESA
jgi:hypothetical protein